MNESEIIVKPLTYTSIIEPKHQFIRNMEEKCKNVKVFLKREPDLVKAVQANLQVVTVDDLRLRDFQSGLLCLTLTEPQYCQAVVNSFVILTKDNMHSTCVELEFLITTLWHRLLPESKINITHLLLELIPACTDAHIDSVIINFMRRLNSGDWSDENCALCSLFFRMIDKLWRILDAHKELHPYLFLTAARLLLDHYELKQNKSSAILTELIVKEVNIVNHLLRDQYSSTVRCGREILRLLLHVAEIPEIGVLLFDIFNRTYHICGNSNEFQQLFEPFPKELAVIHVNHELERWIRFILFECHEKPNTSLKRHLEFLNKRYFCNPGSHLLIPHVIRYIVCNIAPENSKLQPPFYQRWSLCLHLIEICQNPTSPSFANAMLALVIDWVFYTAKTCIMAIEPAMLAIQHNLNTKPHISITILQFMFLSVRRLCPPQSNAMKQSMQSAMKAIINCKVVPDLSPLVGVLWKHGKLLLEFENVFSRPLVGPFIEKYRANVLARSASVSRKTSSMPPVSALVGAPPAKKPTLSVSAPAPSSTKTPESILRTTTTNTHVPPPTPPPPPPPLPQQHSHTPAHTSASTDSVTLVAPTTTTHTPAVSAAARPTTPPIIPVVMKNNNKATKPISAPVDAVTHKKATNITTTTTTTLDDDDDDAVVILVDPFEDESPMAQNHTEHYTKVCKLTPEELLKHIKSVPSQPLQQCLLNLKDSCTVRQHSNLLRFRQEQGEAVCVCMNSLIRHLLEEGPSTIAPEDSGNAGGGGGGGTNATASMLNVIARTVAHLCMAWLRGKILPQQRTDDALKESIASPIFLIIRSVCEMSRTDCSRVVLFSFLAEFYKFVPRIGYYVLYYLTVSQKEIAFHSYRDFCEHLEHDDFLVKLIADLKLVGDESPPLLAYILPSVYSAFTTELGGKLEFLNTIFPRMDGNNMLELLGQVVLENVNFFPSDATLNEALNSSLSLDVWSQYQFWQLINAHEIPTEKFISFMANLEYGKHDEAISHVLIMLKMDRPTESLMRMLYSRKVDKEDLLTISILHFWSISGSTEIKVADITLTLIKANLKLLDKHHEKEKKRRKEEFPLPPLKNILKFLDLLRVKCKNIISDKVNKDHLHHPLLQNNSIQQALQLVNNKAPESLKEEFAELLALAEDVMEEESRGAAPGQGRNLRNLSVRKSAKAEKRMNEKRSSSNNSGSDSNSEDDFVDFNHKKKKKASRMDFD